MQGLAVPYLWAVYLLEGLVNTIIIPLLEPIIATLIPIVINFVDLALESLIIALQGIIFEVYINVLAIVGFLSTVFFVFAGINPVYALVPPGETQQNFALWQGITGQGPVEGYQQVPSILHFFMSHNAIVSIYWGMTILSATLCLIFTGISIMRSMSDTDFDAKKSVGKIWGRLGKAMLTFLLIPVITLASIELTSIVASTLARDVFETGDASIDTIIFLSTTMNAARRENFNGVNAHFDDPVRGPYFRGERHYATMRFAGIRVVQGNGTTTQIVPPLIDRGLPLLEWRQAREDFYLYRIDFVVGFFVSFFMIFILLGAAVFAIRVMLDILLLYILAPFFVAMAPLDEGKRFDAWRDMYVAKMVSCYGLILMMSMYLQLLPLIVGADLRLHEQGHMDAIMKLLLVVGGAFAVRNGHSIALAILNPTAAQHANSSIMEGFAALAVAKMAVSYATGGVSGAIGAGAGAGGGGGGGQGQDPAPGTPGHIQSGSGSDGQSFKG